MDHLDFYIELADQIAELAHAGQIDKAGLPYIEHPRRVAARLPKHLRPAALLHDVVEDTDTTLEDLARQFTPSTIATVDALTKRKGEPKAAYYRRVAADDDATEIKLDGDIADNSDPERLKMLAPETAARLTAKYVAARAAILEERRLLGKAL